MLKQRYSEQYINKKLNNNVRDITCYVKPFDDPDTQCQIALHEAMLWPTVTWFRQVLGHPFEKRLHETLQQHYNHPQLKRTMEKIQCELTGKGYGLLPE